MFIWMRSFCGSAQLQLTLSHEWTLGLIRFPSNDQWEVCDECFLCFANAFFIHVQEEILMYSDSMSWKRAVSTSFVQFTLNTKTMMEGWSCLLLISLSVYAFECFGKESYHQKRIRNKRKCLVFRMEWLKGWIAHVWQLRWEWGVDLAFEEWVVMGVLCNGK